jgi:hypothetical protein
MKFIAHRGYWLSAAEKNTAIAFERALSHGFGIETDFRDLSGKLVVSHDIPVDGAMTADEFIALFRAQPVDALMALNIKSDGLHTLMEDFIKQSGMKDYFVFDMSVPDTRSYLAKNIPVFTRLSEFETVPSFLLHSKGVWLDAFETQWYGMDVIEKLVTQGKHVAIVSPELHRRPHLALWEQIRNHKLHHSSLVHLCTDYPLEAQNYFNF